MFEGDVKNQGFRIGNLIGLQFHLEVKKETIEKWIKMDKKLDGDSKKQIVEKTNLYIDDLHKNCKIMIENFLNL